MGSVGRLVDRNAIRLSHRARWRGWLLIRNLGGRVITRVQTIFSANSRKKIRDKPSVKEGNPMDGTQSNCKWDKNPNTDLGLLLPVNQKWRLSPLIRA